MSDDLPEPDRVPGAPHPRETEALFGQQAAEAEFLAALASGRLHSGWLLAGPHGTGKATLAYRIARALLADRPSAPGTLATDPGDGAARLVRAGSHPRLAVVRRGPNEKGDRLSAEIRGEDVRRLRSFFHLSAPDGGRRVVIVDAADELNATAANAILKELEEPPARTTLLLVAHQPSAILPTIRSRCRTLRLSPLSGADLAAALGAAGLRAEAPEALGVLSGGSVGRAVRLLSGGGLAAYAELVSLFEGVPRVDRPAAIRIAEAAGARGAEARLVQLLDLVETLMARLARAGVAGPPDIQAAPGEARLLARLSPDARAARAWAALAPEVAERAAHARAVNLDPSALILDILLRAEATARDAARARPAPATA